MKLIIHADDFGMARSINEACIELCSLGTLSSVSVMANMPYSAEVEQLLTLTEVSLGLHSTFTEGAPLLPVDQVGSLVDQNGKFHSYAVMMKLAKAKRLSSHEIYMELKAQYECLLERIGERLVFIDSHHSIHNKLLPFRDAFIQFGKDFPIVSAIRTRQMYYLKDCANGRKELTRPEFRTMRRFGLRKVLANTFYRRRAAEYSKVFRIADGMVVENALGALNVFKGFMDLDLSQQAGRTYYAVTHPATGVEDLPESNLKEERIAEYELLRSEEYKAFVQKQPLSNFSVI